MEAVILGMDPETRTLALELTEAVDLAEAGHPRRGYRRLEAGWRRSLRLYASGSRSALELVERYEAVMARFKSRYPIG